MRVAILAFVVACATKAPPSTAPPRAAAPTPAPATGSDEGSDEDGSDVTTLNAKPWVYAPFFNHLKRAIYTEWKPAAVWKALPSTDRPNVETLETDVHITLTPDGAVSNVAVTAPSGVPAIDQECVRAVTAAGPFSNPPPGLVKDGVIAFAFQCYFDVTTAGP